MYIYLPLVKHVLRHLYLLLIHFELFFNGVAVANIHYRWAEFIFPSCQIYIYIYTYIHPWYCYVLLCVYHTLVNDSWFVVRIALIHVPNFDKTKRDMDCHKTWRNIQSNLPVRWHNQQYKTPNRLHRKPCRNLTLKHKTNDDLLLNRCTLRKKIDCTSIIQYSLVICGL